ncbi:MAG: T9SS type A sorting domain-containing protein [Candidatus Latescibacter sp.]|nr:T9SS type A sorting domain-containing protein [Candidatus Latescibacter sp.]
MYNSTFKSGATALTAVQFAGAVSGWQIENCTFTIDSPGNIGIAFVGAAVVASMDILGNTFNGVNGAGGIPSALMIFSSDKVTSLTGLNVTGNVVSKATLQIHSDGATPSNEVINNIRIEVNQFTESNAILIQSTNGSDVAANSAGTKVAGVLAAAGDILIKGNHFGSTATNGNNQYAVKFNKWLTADVNEANIHINYNNIQYPMTTGTDSNGNGGHLTVGATSSLTGIDAKFNWWGTLTGYNTSYQDGGNGVCNPAYDGTQFISSYVTPQVDETNRGIELYDWDGNGKLDRAVVFFDYYVDPATVANYGGWTVALYTFNSARLPKLGLDNSGGGSSDGPFALTLFLTEGSTMDTGVTPQTTYAKQNGYVAGISGNINAKLNDVLAATATERDKAKPVIKTAVTGDANKNGKIDKITVTFSEAVTLNIPTGPPAGTIIDANWDNNVGNPVGYVKSADLSIAAGDVLTLLFSEVGYDTSAKPNFTITQDGSDDFKDNAGNLLTTVTFTGTTDGAPPVAYAVATEDFSTSDRDVGIPDGYIDGFFITYSENVSIAYADSAAARNAFATPAITAGVVENTMNLKTALITGGGTTVLSIAGMSNKDASTAYGSHPWDTDKKPNLTYTSQGGIKDAAGNAWVTFWQPVLMTSVTVFTETSDGADPVIVKAVGQVNSTNIYLTFSEFVKGTGVGNTIAATDLAYVNIYNTGANAAAIAGLVDNSASTDNEARLTTDATLLVYDVESDSLKVAVLGNIKDMSTAGNNLQIINVTINDVIPPMLISSETKDVDNDGWVDHIKLTFSETVDDVALTGYNGGAKISLDTALPNWAVAGYTVIGLNFVGTAAEQTTATTDAVARGIAFAADELVKVINVGDTASDNTLWLMVKELSGPDQTAGDTQAIPAITITGDTAANVADYKPNRLITVTRTTTDTAGPAIMSAKMTGTTSMQVTISETVNTSNILTGGTITGNELIGTDFTIMFGESLVNLGVPSIIKDINQTAGVVDLIWQNTLVPVGESGYIGFRLAGLVKDVATVNVLNTQTATTANNVGLKPITAYIVTNAKTLALSNPNGGEAFKTGSTVIVQWAAANTVAADSVDVYTSADGGSTWTLAAGSRTLASAGAFSWTAVAGSNLKVKAQLSTDAAVKAVSAGVFNVSADAPAVKMLALSNPTAGESFVVLASVNFVWTSANTVAADSVDAFISSDGGVTWGTAVKRTVASAGNFAWTAVLGSNLKAKIQLVSDAAVSSISSGVFNVTAGTPPPPPAIAVSKAVLNNVPSTMAQINNVNVTKVAFTGTATAGDSISVKLVDIAGLEATAATVVANAVGNFTGTVNASPLANGLITLKAGKISGGAVATWYVFADYLKDAVTIGAPTALAVTDVPGDNGGFVYVNFTVSAQHPGMTGATAYNTVQSYQLLKRGTVAPDTLWTAWAQIWPVDPAQLPTNNKQQTVVATVKNGTMQWKLVATTLAGSSAATGPASGGSAKVAELLNGVDKAAEGVFSDVSNVAVGGSVDDIVPSALTVFSADNTPGSGITVSWTPNADHGIVAGYNFNGLTLPIWGVDRYEIYRAVKGTTTFTLVGFGAPGSTSYLDATATPGTTVYDYYIKLVDGNPDHLVKTTDMLGMSAIAGASGTDFNSDGTIGLADLVLLGQAWNTKKSDTTTWISLFDLNKDGVVDLGDLVVLGSNWGASTKKITPAVQTVSNPFELKAEVNENSSMYFVNINVKDAAAYNGVAFTLNYDTKAFEFVKESVNGLVGLSLANESKPGVIDVASYFQNDKFNGTITLGFKSKGLNSDMNLRMVNAEVAINNVVSAVSGAPAVTLKALPTVYAMNQNFPNPFNPSTTITYSIPKTSHVELAIYNMAGQKIRTLVNTSQAASFYRVVWNGKNDFGQTVASGMFFYKLDAGNYSKVVKMNLIK